MTKIQKKERTKKNPEDEPGRTRANPGRTREEPGKPGERIKGGGYQGSE